ncbi:MAG: NAD-dependent epimerase/dehydratase family protein [Betaproteobacteria bacterium]
MGVLVTGAAGFIGFHVARSLLDRGDTVTGVDNLNDYYDPGLKRDRLQELSRYPAFSFKRCDIADVDAVSDVFSEAQPERVVHLAAQAGVRYSLVNPHAYGHSNLTGFLNVLEASRSHKVGHLLFASSSSVYGNTKALPLSELSAIDSPISLYAATKASNELMAHSYAHLYGMRLTGVRYFTVYGPWGRPDMAPWIFTQRILAKEPITVFNHGNMLRDFTYIDDATKATVALLDREDNERDAIINVGNAKPEKLNHFIKILERSLGREAIIEFAPLQEGDVKSTHASVERLKELTGFTPATDLTEGLSAWADWFKRYHDAR